MNSKSPNRCLSCGKTQNTGKRKYCSIQCRQLLRYRLELHSGLLQALNTRYASFYFNHQHIILDVLPQDASRIFSFIYSRSKIRKPADAFDKMADALSSAWWLEKKKTNRDYLARRYVLDQAFLNKNPMNLKTPPIVKRPTGVGQSMSQLEIDYEHLDAQDLPRMIKNAFRKQAKKYHPDIGGNDTLFRKIHEAYERLIAWSKNPTYQKRRGFPDKWFYDGSKKKWYQPISLPK